MSTMQRLAIRAFRRLAGRDYAPAPEAPSCFIALRPEHLLAPLPDHARPRWSDNETCEESTK